MTIDYFSAALRQPWAPGKLNHKITNMRIRWILHSKELCTSDGFLYVEMWSAPLTTAGQAQETTKPEEACPKDHSELACRSTHLHTACKMVI